MNISDAKKVMLDRVNLAIEEAQLRDEIQATEKQIKKLEYWAEELQMQYDDLANSGMRQFFLGLIGKKEERLQEAENEVRKKNGELSAAKFELQSQQSRLEEIEQTTKEIEATCNTCLQTIADADGEAARTKLLAISELPKICMDITEHLAETKPFLKESYDIYAAPRVSRNTPGGSSVSAYYNKDYEMRKQSKHIEEKVNRLIELLSTYNLYAPEEIEIEFHGAWMEKENYWEGQQMDYDTMERIKTVDEWFFGVDSRWKVMKKQQKEAMQKLQEEMFGYLDT